MGGESEAAWRTLLDDLVKRGLKTPELAIVDGAPGLKPLPHCGPTSRFSAAARCISIATFSLMLPIGCMTNFPPITRI